MVDGKVETEKGSLVKVFFCATVTILCLVLLVFPHLPFPDYPNHMARYYLLTRDYGSPLYQQFYTDNFRIIPNIGVDVLMAGIGRIIDPALGLRLLLIGTVVLASTGSRKLSALRNVGAWHPALILVPVTLVSYSMVFGFLNFVLATSILPWAIYWYEKATKPSVRFAAIVAAALILFFCHLMVGVLFLLIIGTKLVTEPDRSQKLNGIGAIFTSFVAMGLLYKLSPVTSEASTIVFTSLIGKVKFFLTCMSFGPWWMVTSALTFIGIGLVALLKQANLQRSDKVILVGLLLFYLVCPFGFKISANMDGRIPALMLTMFLAMARFRAESSRSHSRGLAMGLFAIALVNLGSIFMVIRRTDQEANKILGILRRIPAGDVLYVADVSQREYQRADWYPAYRMLAYYTMAERPLFLAGLFVYPSQQPVILKKELEGIGFASTPYKATDSISFQVADSLKTMQPRFERLKNIGVKKSWVFFVNYDSTGFAEARVSGTEYSDQNYLLAHVDN